MQLFEGMAWRSLSASSMPDGCSPSNSNAAYAAMVANVTQPILLGLALVAVAEVPAKFKVIAMGIVFAYICWLVYAVSKLRKQQCLKPTKDCEHLDLVWWKSFPGGALPYLITLFSVMFLLLRPFNLMIFTSAFIAITLGLSAMFYSCGTGSMWCWFAAFAPLATGVFWYFNGTDGVKIEPF